MSFSRGSRDKGQNMTSAPAVVAHEKPTHKAKHPLVPKTVVVEKSFARKETLTREKSRKAGEACELFSSAAAAAKAQAAAPRSEPCGYPRGALSGLDMNLPPEDPTKVRAPYAYWGPDDNSTQ